MTTLTGLAAHGLGGRQDLPIPFEAALAGAAAAVLATFVVLAVAWREPRRPGPAAGQPLPARLDRALDAPATGGGCGCSGLPRPRTLARLLRPGPRHQPHRRGGVRAAVGRRPAAVGTRRPGAAAGQSLATLHLVASRLLGRKPDDGLLPMPEGVGAGRRRWFCWASSGWNSVGGLWLLFAA